MRIQVIFMAYQKPEIVEQAIVRFKEQTDLEGLHDRLDITICDFKYPLPHRRENMKKLLSIAGLHNISYRALNNKGVSGNYAQVANLVHMHKDDIVLFYDPDSMPAWPSYLKSAMKVIKHFNKVGYVTLSRIVADAEQKSSIQVAHSVRVKRLVRACGWPMGIWTARFLKQVKDEIELPQKYGYFENHILNLMDKHKYKGFIMLDEKDGGYNHIQAAYDPDYIMWKRLWALQKTKLCFEDYLLEKGNTEWKK